MPPLDELGLGRLLAQESGTQTLGDLLGSRLSDIDTQIAAAEAGRNAALQEALQPVDLTPDFRTSLVRALSQALPVAIAGGIGGDAALAGAAQSAVGNLERLRERDEANA